MNKINFLLGCLAIISLQGTQNSLNNKNEKSLISSLYSGIQHSIAHYYAKLTNIFSSDTVITHKNYKRHPHCSSFGQYSYAFDIDVRIWGDKTNFSVGKFCSISNYLTIFLGGNHRVDWISTFPFPSQPNNFPEATNIKDFAVTKGNVIIGNDVWIGSHVTILSGVTIGDGAVIGAYSVVAKNIPPYAIAVGNPARVIRYRFDEKTIEYLLKLKWWDWPINKIRNNVKLLCSSSMQDFIESNPV